MVLEGLRAEILGERQLREGRHRARAPAQRHIVLQAGLYSGRAVLHCVHRLLVSPPSALLVVGPLFIGDLAEHAAWGNAPQHRVLHALVALAPREVLRQR